MSAQAPAQAHVVQGLAQEFFTAPSCLASEALALRLKRCVAPATRATNGNACARAGEIVRAPDWLGKHCQVERAAAWPRVRALGDVPMLRAELPAVIFSVSFLREDV